MEKKRLFIVSNRLPVIVDENKQVQQATGGLITAINGYLGKNSDTFDEVLWAGAPGCTPETWNAASKSLDDKGPSYLPVFIPQSEYKRYYNGFSNSVIWPLFHYFPSYAEYNLDDFASFKRVNEKFSDLLAKNIRRSDTVWIHDYHLLPLAAMLRKEFPDVTIGFFLHIPFPSFEIFRLLPRQWQEYLLKGMMGADLIGFHTIDYASHFLQTISMVLGMDNERHIIHYDNRVIKIDVFPISIDFEKFNNAFDNAEVASIRETLKRKMANQKIIFSVDRLDYTKGVQNRLRAYDYFLSNNKEYHGKVVFIMVIVPSRDTIPRYAERKRMIDEMISQINSNTGNIHWIPVVYQYNHLRFNELLALFTSCDLALITPLRDGMNLVSKEFVASRKDKKGVLIISEMAGAARELTDALTINPNDTLEIADKIKEGLEMPIAEQTDRLNTMQRRISDYDVTEWAKDFLTQLNQIKQKQQAFQIKFLDLYSKGTLYDAYRNSRRRLLLLDYDGTMSPFRKSPDIAIPDNNVLQLLKDLGDSPENDVYLISGRTRKWLEEHFGNLQIGLVAEHGAEYKSANQSLWLTPAPFSGEWKDEVGNIMATYIRRCANSTIEEKDFSIVWHYRNCNVQQGKIRAMEMLSELNEYIHHHRHLQVLMGNRIVEVRNGGMNKGKMVKMILEASEYDFIFAAGDDRTDEDMFRVLSQLENAFTIKVGSDASYAQYNLHTPQMVISLLEGLTHIHWPAFIQSGL
jgi:trehalose 6-phosphate synthase/phosphatase